MTNVIGGAILVLCDGGANRCVKGNSTRLISYNKYRKCGGIGISGDNKITGAPLCTRVSIIKSNKRWKELIWFNLESSGGNQTPKKLNHFKLPSKTLWTTN